jgi:hypothetical protein
MCHVVGKRIAHGESDKRNGCEDGSARSTIAV